jgi:ApbE superfamily uncharacterized protein (UPF0280 family)
MAYAMIFSPQHLAPTVGHATIEVMIRAGSLKFVINNGGDFVVTSG